MKKKKPSEIIKGILKECVLLLGACVWIVWIFAAMALIVMGVCGHRIVVILEGFLIAIAWGGLTTWISVNCHEEDEGEWIPVWEELPRNDKYILMSFSNYSNPMIGRYEKSKEGGAFYIGDEDVSCVAQELFVNAWMPLPERYKEESETWELQ